MGDPLTKNKMVAGRGVPPAQPKVLLKFVPPSKWLMEFDTWVMNYTVARLIFKSGNLPTAFSLAPTRKNDAGSNLALEWTLTWQGRMSDHISELTPFGERALQRTDLLSVAQGDEFDRDVFRKEQAQDLENQRRREANQTFLPALNMTAEEALRTLKPGNYVAAPQLMISTLPSRKPGETFPPNVDWIREYRDGYFVQRGLAGNMTMVPVSSNPQFWKDIVWFLQEGASLHDAVIKFDKRWDELIRMTIGAFALAMTSAPAIGPRADLGETAFAAAQREASRMVGRKVSPPKKFGNMSKIDPIDAANTAVVATGVAMEVSATIDDLKRKSEEEHELESVGDAITKVLADKIVALPQQPAVKDLRTGQLGEAIVKETLKLRGYAVVELQNASGQGIDLVAIKVKGNFIVYLEIKTSIADYSVGLSEPQKDMRNFVRSRLDRVVAHEGLYKNVPENVIEIARLLVAEIDSGRPIGGIRATVQSVNKGPNLIKVRFDHWRSQVPRATALKPKK